MHTHPATFLRRGLRAAAIATLSVGLAATGTAALAATPAPSPAPAAPAADKLSPTFLPIDAIPANGSRPTAPLTIWLDFVGGKISETSWNYTKLNRADFTAKPTALTTEQQLAAYQVVAQAFGPFNINVTTKNPGADKLNKTSDTDKEYGSRLIVAGNSTTEAGFTAILGGGDGTGGIATQDSFGNQFTNIAWVRGDKDSTALKLPNPGFAVGTAAVHEIGHQFGLQHKGFSPAGWSGQTDYYMPQEGIWGPFLGSVGYVGQARWAGDYPGDSHSSQDDLATITGTLPDAKKKTNYAFAPTGELVYQYCTVSDGNAYLPIDGKCSLDVIRDDNKVRLVATYAGRAAYRTPANASAANDPLVLDASSGSYAGQDEIVRNGQANYYTFTVPAKGDVTIGLTPQTPYSMLDLKATLRSAAGATVATANPQIRQVSEGSVSGIDATFALKDVAAGTYTLAVEQASFGTMSDNTGDRTVASPTYGALGAYAVALTVPKAAAAALPELVVANQPSASGAVVAASVTVPADWAGATVRIDSDNYGGKSFTKVAAGTTVTARLRTWAEGSPTGQVTARLTNPTTKQTVTLTPKKLG